MFENKSNKELADDINALEARIARVKRESGNKLSFSQKEWIKDSQLLVEDLDHELKTRPVDGPLTLQTGNLLGGQTRGSGIRRDGAYDLIGPNEAKDYGLVNEIKSELFPLDAEFTSIGEPIQQKPIQVMQQVPQAGNFTRSADLDIMTI